MDEIFELFRVFRNMKDEEGYANFTFNNYTGAFGEHETVKYLNKGNLPGYFKILSNVVIPTDAISAEIDILVIHETGLYVLESKNVGGFIFGSAEQKNWTICYNKNSKYSMYNPIFQNRSHCKALQKCTGVNENNMFSYIVFSERCELKNVPADTNLYKIMQRQNLVRVIRDDMNSKKCVLGINDIDVIYENLSQYAGTNKAKHLKEVKKMKEGNECPYCGANLVERSGKYGKFMGCDNYPKCKFTRNI